MQIIPRAPQEKQLQRQRALQRIVFVASIVAFAGYGAWSYWAKSYLPLSATDAESLSWRMGDRHQRQIKQQHKAWRREAVIFTPSAAQQRRLTLRNEMLQTGANASEVDGVLKVFDKTTRKGFRGGGSLEPLYFWPLYAEKGSIDNQSAWVIECAWESVALLRNEPHIYPGHFWRLVIDAAPPHPVLDSQNCM